MLMSVGRNRRRKPRVGVRTYGRNTQEKRLARSKGIIEELQRSIRNDVGGILALYTPVFIFV